MTQAVALSDRARRAWRELSYLIRADERAIARGLGCSAVQAREALEELQAAGIAERKMHRPSKGRPPAMRWALTKLKKR